MMINRTERRKLTKKGGHKRPIHQWGCPECGKYYKVIFTQSDDMPYLFCYLGCEQFFDLKDNNVTTVVLPTGKF